MQTGQIDQHDAITKGEDTGTGKAWGNNGIPHAPALWWGARIDLWGLLFSSFVFHSEERAINETSDFAL